ncbi:MAG: PrsW family intramembrane metalloprotease [Myxococcales bacterium]|nr:PrsW family intramembrane metalloprotease [Myxococcales bacterium]
MGTTSELVWVLSALLAAIPIAICYGARWWLDRGSLEPPWSFPVVMLAGGVGGVLFSLYGSPEVERLLAHWWGLPVASDSLLVGSVVVPAAEELGKAIVLLPFALTPWFRGPVDGLVYGFAAGAGFACAESFMYFATAWEVAGPDAWFWEVVTRTVPAALIHGGSGAALGAFLGAGRFDGRPLVGFWAPVTGFVAAMLIHGGWNWLVGAAAETGDLRFHQAAALSLPLVFMAGVLSVRAALRVELRGTAPGLALELRAGIINHDELRAALDRRFRRRGAWLRPAIRRGPMVGALLGLGLALHRYRQQGRGARRVNRWRARLVRARGPAA